MPSRADSDLARRDTLLPGLATLLEPEALIQLPTHLLHHGLPFQVPVLLDQTAQIQRRADLHVFTQTDLSLDEDSREWGANGRLGERALGDAELGDRRAVPRLGQTHHRLGLLERCDR